MTVLEIVVIAFGSIVILGTSIATWYFILSNIRADRASGRRLPPPWVWLTVSAAVFALMFLIAWLTRGSD
jgi:hypothetical protein